MPVPFERQFLDGKLGRSNEPYLNKPARHKAMSLDNAVRGGNDSHIQKTCISVLSKLSSQEANDALIDAIFFTLHRPSMNDSSVKLNGGMSIHAHLKEFADLILSTSNEGESCALLTGLAFHFLSYSLSESLDIRVHPVNQSGASSKEILDVDVYAKNKLRFTAEVKDKAYTREDVDHAAYKVRLAGHGAMLFIEGPNASTGLSNAEINEIGLSQGVRITVVSAKAFFLVALGLCSDDVDPSSAWEKIVKISQSAKFKQTTNIHIQNMAVQVGLIEPTS